MDIPDESAVGAGDVDLDALIGDIRHESARRRAAPDFPLEAEASLAVEADRQAPAGNRPRLERLAELAQALSEEWGADPAGSPRSSRLQPRTRDPRIEVLKGRTHELARLVATCLSIASGRLGDLEDRVRRLERRPAAAVTAGAPDGTESELGLPAAGVGFWLPLVVEAAGSAPGRVLYAGQDAPVQVRFLRDEGLDAYGVVSAGRSCDSFDDSGDDMDVRHANLDDHLGSVADSGLSLVVISEPACRVALDRLAPLVAELARVTTSVALMSEAPWWWTVRVGSPVADLASERPLAAETWISILDRAGFLTTAAYDADGRSFLVRAVRGTASAGSAAMEA